MHFYTIIWDLKIGEGIITNEGKKEGEWKYFYENGTVSSSGSYSNNLRNRYMEILL